MTQKIISKIDTEHGWNVLSLISGVTSVCCFVVYIVLY